MKKLKNILLISIPLLGLIACHKDAFLNAKPSSSIIVPSTLEDFQSLLDNVANYASYGSRISGMAAPYMGEESSDNFYLTTTVFNTQALIDRNIYVWAKDIYNGSADRSDWNIPYQQIMYTNTVLDNIDNVQQTSSNIEQWKNIKGTALFTRSLAFYNLASIFAPAYDSKTAQSELGIILKTSSDVNINPGRATVQATYNQIIADAKASANLLSSTLPQNIYQNRPSKVAAYAFLARVYLSMRDYVNAKTYADSCLKNYNILVDYNTLPSGNYPFTLSKPTTAEVLYQESLSFRATVLFVIGASQLTADSTLYKSYDTNDIRKKIFFRTTSGLPTLGWTYSGVASSFAGLATDEIYLIRAECSARAGDTNAALADLNTLLSKRYVTNFFQPITASSSTDALAKILIERRKELIWRGLRWTDLKRLNKEGANITLTRSLNGQLYTLPVNSPLYVLPIPPDEIATSGVQQNQR
jgi:hypothetical protein